MKTKNLCSITVTATIYYAVIAYLLALIVLMVVSLTGAYYFNLPDNSIFMQVTGVLSACLGGAIPFVGYVIFEDKYYVMKEMENV